VCGCCFTCSADRESEEKTGRDSRDHYDDNSGDFDDLASLHSTDDSMSVYIVSSLCLLPVLYALFN